MAAQATNDGLGHVIEPEKRVPVARTADVIVAGAGISGLFAALGAAKGGARTVLVDRFGQLGGNIGPGLLVGGSLHRERQVVHEDRPVGLAAEFIRRVDALREGLPEDYAVVSQAVSRAAVEMMAEAGVETILSAYAADPVMEGRRVTGLFLETKSGRVAVRGKVVVDATGDADIARRAGAPFRKGISPAEGKSPNIWDGYNQPQYRTWNDGGIYLLVAGADIGQYRAFADAPRELSAEDKKWAEQHLGYYTGGWTAAMTPLLRAAWESGEFRVIRRVGEGETYVCLSNYWFTGLAPHLAGSRCHVFGEYDAGDWKDVSEIESELRALAYDAMRFYRRHVPGFVNAALVFLSPFLGGRGGPFIEGEHTLTPQESFAGYRSPDVLYVSYAEVRRKGNPSGHDMPYGMLLPRGVEGLLVTGRGAAYSRRGHDPSTRARLNMMLLGQATGLAAAMAAAEGVTPRALDVRKLQRALLREGFHLGDEARLRELGLSGAGP